MGPLGPFDWHRVATRIRPVDLDPFCELNNGRTLTIYDLGLALYDRLGVAARIAAHGWRPTVAGASVRYRARIRAFDRIEIASRVLGWDGRFFYLDQALWRGHECCNHVLVRMAFTTGRGIVAADDVAVAMGWATPSPALPDWVQAWSEAEARRPWPPLAPPGAVST